MVLTVGRCVTATLFIIYVLTASQRVGMAGAGMRFTLLGGTREGAYDPCTKYQSGQDFPGSSFERGSRHGHLKCRASIKTDIASRTQGAWCATAAFFLTCEPL